MLDIIQVPEDGRDLQMAMSVVPKAANVLSIQLQSLEYAQEFGVDLRFFLNSDLQFQNSSFKAYLIERLTQSQINVVEVLETIETLFQRYSFGVSNADDNNGGLIA